MNFFDIYFIRVNKYKISRESVSCGLRFSARNYQATDGETDSWTDMMKLIVSFHSLMVLFKNVTIIQKINLHLQALIHTSILM